MVESTAPPTASRGRKLAICALVLALAAIMLGIHAVGRLARIDTRISGIVQSREELAGQAAASTTACADLTREYELAVRRLTELSARFDDQTVQYKALAAAQERMKTPRANLLTDGGFEQPRGDGRPADWQTANIPGQHEGPRTKPVIDTGVKLEGNSSLRIDHVETGQYTYTYQTRSVRSNLKPNTDYLYTGHFRVENILPAKQFGGIKLIVSTGSHMPFALSDQPNYAAEGVWQKIELRFNTGDREPIYCGITFHKCKGTLWLDDFYLEEVEPVP